MPGTQRDRRNSRLDWNGDHKVLGYGAKESEQRPVRVVTAPILIHEETDSEKVSQNVGVEQSWPLTQRFFTFNFNS